MLSQDLQALKNLYTVADASVTIDSVYPGKINYHIVEALTVFPIVSIGGIKDNLWFQVGIKQIHHFGRGIESSAVYGNIDGRNNIDLFFRNLNLNGSRWGLAVNALRWASTEPLFFGEGTVTYDYDINYLALLGSYQLSVNEFIEFGGAYFTEQYKKEENQTLSEPPGPDLLKQNKTLLKLSYNIDRKNHFSFYIDGFGNRFIAQSVYTLDDQSWFHIFINDITYLKKIGTRTNLASRLRVGLSTNRDTPFAPFVIDSRLNIRGSGNRIDRGTGQIILNAEIRRTIFDVGYFAGQAVLFSDMGTWRNPGGNLNDFVDRDNFRHFVGAGLRLIYKRAFNAMLRLDYGIDVYNSRQRGFVLGFGQYF